MRVNDADLAEIMSRGGRQHKKPKEVKQDYGNNKDHGARISAKNESVHKHAAKTSRYVAEPLPQVIVRFTHHCRRLADADSYIGKWFLDGIVEAGILHDDSPEYVKEVTHRQVKIEMWQEEKTVIELIEAS